MLEHSIFLPDTYLKSTLPAQVRGDVIISKFKIEPLRPEEQPEEGIPDWARRRPGKYTALDIDGIRMMTDLYEEWWSQRKPIEMANELGGHILISGLGLGLIIDSILSFKKSPVEKITVLEKNEHIISLVAPHVCEKYGSKLEIIQADVLQYKPLDHVRFSVVWHDIWPNPASVPDKEIEMLTHRYKPICQWLGFWTVNSYK